MDKSILISQINPEDFFNELRKVVKEEIRELESKRITRNVFQLKSFAVYLFLQLVRQLSIVGLIKV